MGTPDGLAGILRAAQEGNQGAAVRKPAKARLAIHQPFQRGSAGGTKQMVLGLYRDAGDGWELCSDP
jgi:hypothetical protein